MRVWKKKASATIETPCEFPDGCLVVTESVSWYIKGAYRYQVTSERVERSWHFPLIVRAKEAALAKYLKGGKLGFRPGTLLFNDGKYYLIFNNKARKVSSPDVFDKFGIEYSNAVWVSDEELGLHKEGENFS